MGASAWLIWTAPIDQHAHGRHLDGEEERAAAGLDEARSCPSGGARRGASASGSPATSASRTRRCSPAREVGDEDRGAARGALGVEGGEDVELHRAHVALPSAHHSTRSTNTLMRPPQDRPTCQAVSSATPNSKHARLAVGDDVQRLGDHRALDAAAGDRAEEEPSPSMARWLPTGRGAEPQVSTTVASATPRPARRQASACAGYRCRRRARPFIPSSPPPSLRTGIQEPSAVRKTQAGGYLYILSRKAPPGNGRLKKGRVASYDRRAVPRPWGIAFAPSS